MSHAALLDPMTYSVVGSSDVLLCFSSLYWVTGWNILICGTINGATRIITTQLFSVEVQFRLVEKYGVTFALNAAPHLAAMSRSDRLQQANLSSLKCQIVTGGKSSHFTQIEMSSHLPNGSVHAAYGMSEAAGIVTMNLGDKDSVGQIAHSYRIKLIDDNGNRCGIGKDGEICFKANYRFLGYYGNQAATDGIYDKEGFIMSGDIGHFDEDGNLVVVDRKKDIIKYGNIQVSPSELESYLGKSPAIKSACVIGIHDEDSDNDLPTAFIVRNEQVNITEKEVSDMIAGKCLCSFQNNPNGSKYFSYLRIF